MSYLRSNAIKMEMSNTDLLPLVQSRSSTHSPADDEKVNVVLQDQDLWCKFNSQNTEMIITKIGRKMFPIIRLKIQGLIPHAMYSVALELVQISRRWKYMNGEWTETDKGAPPLQSVYFHPEAPNFGSHWMSSDVSFSKIKLTNKLNSAGNNGRLKVTISQNCHLSPRRGDGIKYENVQTVLNSLHKYEPRVHIIQVGTDSPKRLVATFSLPEAQFIAVTAYQNEDIKELKVRYNPYAKAFSRRSPRMYEEYYLREEVFGSYEFPVERPSTSGPIERQSHNESVQIKQPFPEGNTEYGAYLLPVRNQATPSQHQHQLYSYADYQVAPQITNYHPTVQEDARPQNSSHPFNTSFPFPLPDQSKMEVQIIEEGTEEGSFQTLYNTGNTQHNYNSSNNWTPP